MLKATGSDPSFYFPLNAFYACSLCDAHRASSCGANRALRLVSLFVWCSESRGCFGEMSAYKDTLATRQSEIAQVVTTLFCVILQGLVHSRLVTFISLPRKHSNELGTGG